MSANYSSSTNDFIPFQSSSFFPSKCLNSTISGCIFLTATFTNIILLLPISVFVLHLGFQHWKQQRCASSAAVMSLSDFVTYNMAVIELIGVLGNILITVGIFSSLSVILNAGMLIGVFPWNGQMLFPILSCVERYLAVVHPITYLGLRQASGVRIRNISTALVWLQCFAGMGFMVQVIRIPLYLLLPSIFQSVLVLITVIYCSVSVLSVLIRPRPGEASGNRGRVDQSKQRAFNTIMIIMGVLLLRFGGNLVCSGVVMSQTMNVNTKCVVTLSSVLFSLPSSLVLPLLFLHREGKLPGCKHNTQSHARV